MMISEKYSTTKYGTDAKALRDKRAKELRAEGYTVKIKKVSFLDLARAVVFYLDATKEG